MKQWASETEARYEIKSIVKDYYQAYLRNEKEFMPGDRVSYAGRVFDENEMCNLTDALLDFWLTSGRFSNELERELADWIGVKYAHLVNSGSSANLVAFMALTAQELGKRRIMPGDEVITVACSFPTTVAPIIQYGAVPVFVDITIPQYNIDIEAVRSAITKKTKAIIVAHTLGNPFDIKEIRKLCDLHNLWLIEDNCDALGSEYTINGVTKKTGSWGDIATSSFYPPHHITMGEGGCVYTNDSVLSKLILSYRDWGRDCVCPSGKDNSCGHRFDGQYGSLPFGYDHKYVYSHFGYNLKMTDLQASIGLAQLSKIDDFIVKRKHNWNYLRKELESLQDVFILPEANDNSDPSWFGFLITIKSESGIKRLDMVRYLESNNIQTRLLFSGNIIRHPCFDSLTGGSYRIVGSLDNTDYVMNNSFWVGVYPGLTDEMLKYVTEKIKESVIKMSK